MPSVEYTQKDNNDFLFGLSLAEIIILLFFILALLFLYTVKNQKKEYEKQSEIVEACGVELNQAKSQIEVYSKATNRSSYMCESELIVMRRNEAEFKGTETQQKNRIKELEEQQLVLMQNEKKASAVAKLVDELGITEKELAAFAKEKEKIAINGSPEFSLSDTLEENKKLNREIKNLAMELKKLEIEMQEIEAKNDGFMALEDFKQTVSVLESENRDCVAQVARQKKQCGLDFPPCWIAVGGKPEYLFNITVTNAGFDVARTYKDSRVEAASRIPGVDKLEDRSLTGSQFSGVADSIYQWSVARNCRHYVRVFDSENTSKGTYKKRLRLLENYFYKYEP